MLEVAIMPHLSCLELLGRLAFAIGLQRQARPLTKEFTGF
jgi:hypothetical protein